MKKFKFELETLLKVRKKKEDAVAQELASAQSELMAIMAAIDGIDREIGEQIASIKRNYETAINITFVRLAMEYLKSLKIHRAQEEENAAKKEEEILKIKERLAAAMKERKILEKYKESKQEQYRHEYNRNDDISMDELNNNRQNLNKE